MIDIDCDDSIAGYGVTQTRAMANTVSMPVIARDGAGRVAKGGEAA